jgi:serine/threonine-protein kinase
VIGETIGARYTIVRQLGEGGMGAVYEARANVTGQRVALKLITGSFATDREQQERFEREALAARAVASEHIVEVLDVGRDEAKRVPFLAMEFLVGEDLEQVFARLGPVPADVALRIGAQACRGLERAHAAGIVHRDIKPANLFLAAREGEVLVVKVLDFGIAKVDSALLLPDEKRRPLTRTGALVGSPLYMSPEQSRGRDKLDHRTDLWSLGIVLYQALVGRTPFDEVTSLGDFIVAVCTIPITAIRERAPWVDPLVAHAVERALAIDPANRYASAAEMREAFSALLPEGETLRASMLVRAPEAGPAPAPLADSEEPPSTVPATPFGAMTPNPPATRVALTIPAQPMLSALTPPPTPAATSTKPAPKAARSTPRVRRSWVAIVGLVGAGGALALGGAYAVGWPDRSTPAPPSPADAASPETTANVSPLVALRPLTGSWWSEAGVTYDGVLVGDALELRLTNPDQLPGQAYAPGEAEFVLRPAEGEPNTFHVEARIRPVAPRSTMYDRARAATSCVASITKARGMALLAVHAIDRLVVQTVKLDPAPASFVREGTRVVSCTGLAEAHATSNEVVLGRTPVSPSTTPRWMPPPHDTGLHDPLPHDAGAHEPAMRDAGTHDPGPHLAAPDAGTHEAGGVKLGGACEADAQCASGNCFARRCMPPGKGYGAPCTMDWQCGTHRCKDSSCR